MAFKLLAPPDATDRRDDVDPCDAALAAQQLALHLNDGAPARITALRTNSPAALNRHIVYIAGQIEALRQQLRDHSADRIALLLHEMIAERERALDRYLAQEASWDRRLAALENAVAERDSSKQREAALIRERDAARAAAASAAAERDAARHQADALHRIAEGAKAEQLRLRAEREIDRKAWSAQRSGLMQQLEGRGDRNWLARLMRA